VKDELFIGDVIAFLDNVLQDFIDRAPNEMERAKYSAYRERSIGLGVMGFHSYLQKNMMSFSSIAAKSFNKKVFQHIKTHVDAASKKIANLKAPCPDNFQMHVEKLIDANKIALDKEFFVKNQDEIYANYCKFLSSENAEFSIENKDLYKSIFEKIQNIAERFTNKTAVAPTASISEICGSVSPGIEPFMSNSFLKKNLSGVYHVRNRYLESLLERKGFNNEEIWQSIESNQGSVMHLDCLNEDEKSVFMTAFEIDQVSMLEFAKDRTPYIDQAQSLNLFLPSNISKKDLHRIHFTAWKFGIKSLYYLRSFSLGRGENINQMQLNLANSLNKAENDECLSCQ
jgi:ribonucleoside-diphosphate reductase alpha chain